MSDEKKYLSMEDIEKHADVRYAEAEAWGGILRLASLSADEMIEFVESNEGPGRKLAGIRMLVRSMVDGEGKRIGTEQHLEVLKKKDSGTVSKLVGMVMELNGMRVTLPDLKNASSGATAAASPTVLH